MEGEGKNQRANGNEKRPRIAPLGSSFISGWILTYYML